MWCHSKLNPHSTSSPAGEEQFSRILLSRDDDAAGGVSKRRRLERSRRPRRHKLGPVSPVFPEAAGRVKRQRGARRRRATLSLSNGGGSSLHSIEIPGTLSSSWVLKIEHPRELQLVPYPLALDRRVESAAGGVGSNQFWNRIHCHGQQNSAADRPTPRASEIGGPRLLHDRISRPKLSPRRHAAVVGALPRVSNHLVAKKHHFWSGK